MNQLQSLLEGYQPGRLPKVIRSGLSYQQHQDWTKQKLTMLLEQYHKQESYDQTTQLIRKDFDQTLRSFHQYCIEENVGAHYCEMGIDQGEATEFEHVIPERLVREAVFVGKLTLIQAMNTPTCRLRTTKHLELGKQGWGQSTPDPFWFWRRYLNIDVEIKTRDGVSVDLNTWNLNTHYKHFGVI